MWEQIREFFADEVVRERSVAVLIALVGFVFARLISRAVEGLVRRQGGPQAALLARRLSFYLVLGVAVMVALDRLGLDLGVLLGAAGVLTVAIGFASQTSASNVVSGLFLMGERPFGIGDAIQVAGVEGEVLSIDWLSVKLRTWQNTFVRIPNETIIKSEVINLTRFPIRRVDLFLDVAYDQSLEEVERVLLDLCYRLEFVLAEPAAFVRVSEFGASGMRVGLLAWVQSRNFIEHRTRLLTEVKRAFDSEGIVIPFQQIVVHQSNEDAQPGH